MMKKFFVLLMLILVIVFGVNGEILRVTPGGGCSGDGSSWANEINGNAANGTTPSQTNLNYHIRNAALDTEF